MVSAIANKIWKVVETSASDSGTCYVLLTDGSMLIRSAHGTPSVRSCRRMLALVEEGLPHPATLLLATPDTLAIRIAGSGEPGQHHIRPGDGAMRGSALVAAGLLAGCGGNANLPKPDNAVRGHVTYFERMALPADAEVAVQLLDVSRQNAAATPVADTTIRPDGRQVPLPFVLRFDPQRIDPRHEYAVRATITSEGRQAFTTTTTVRVITRDHPTMVDLVLSPVQAAAAAPPALTGSWVLEDIGGTGVMDSARATLEFREPGRVSGRASCNQFSGPVTVTGSAISFGPLVSTRMACADAAMNQETKYLKALQDAERYSLDGATLLIYSKGADQPLRFRRSDEKASGR